MELINSIKSVNSSIHDKGQEVAPKDEHAAFLRLGAIRQIAVFGIHHSSPNLNLLISPVHAYYHVYIYPTSEMVELNRAIKPELNFFEASTLKEQIEEVMQNLEDKKI